MQFVLIEVQVVFQTSLANMKQHQTFEILLVEVFYEFSTNTLVNVNAPVVATTSWWLIFSTGGGVKGKKNLYLLTF